MILNQSISTIGKTKGFRRMLILLSCFFLHRSGPETQTSGFHGSLKKIGDDIFGAKTKRRCGFRIKLVFIVVWYDTLTLGIYAANLRPPMPTVILATFLFLAKINREPATGGCRRSPAPLYVMRSWALSSLDIFTEPVCNISSGFRPKL